MPNNPVPLYKRAKIVKMLTDGKGVGHIAKETDVCIATIKKYEKMLWKVVKREIDHIDGEF